MIPTLLAAALLATSAPSLSGQLPEGPLSALPVAVGAADIRISVDGPVMEVTQRLELRNPGSVEAAYELVFPLGRGAAVSSFSALAGGDDLAGRVLEGDEARAEFRRLATEHGDAALLEHYGQSVYRLRVFPVPASGSRELTLSYTCLVDTQGDLQRIHLPLTAFRGSEPFELSISGEVRTDRPLATLYSPTHPAREGDSWESWDEANRPHYHTEFSLEDAAFLPEEDFLLFYKAPPGAGWLDVSVLAERPDTGDPDGAGTFLAVVRGRADDTSTSEPKNVVFVLDRSGSMEGQKLEQARAALGYLVRNVRPEDRFNLVTYAEEATLFALEMQGSTERAKVELLEHLADVEADGGTNIEAALTLALDQFQDDGVLHQIVFITDGLPTDGQTDPGLLSAVVREANEHGARLVAFGLGHDVNASLLDRLARQNHGMVEYVLPGEPIDERVPGFYERMDRPILVDARFEWEGVAVHDLFPAEAGDLYDGHSILITGRYAQPGSAVLRVTGTRASETVSESWPLELPARTPRDASELVGRIWAAKKIGFLVDELRLAREGEDLNEDELESRAAEIVQLGIRFGILTEYTAFLAEGEAALWDTAANIATCADAIRQGVGVDTGSHGVAQASNSKTLQRLGCVSSNEWLGEDGQLVRIDGVQCVAGRTFFRRGEDWIDPSLAPDAEARYVALFSDEFFGLLEEHPWLAACVARTGRVILELEGEAVRFGPGC